MDDMVFARRWQQLIANRDRLDLVEANTWNESVSLLFSSSSPRHLELIRSALSATERPVISAP